MILIADSGSTKCDWLLINEKGDRLDEFRSIGLNPYFHSADFIADTLRSNAPMMKVAANLEKVYFYGAGASTERLCNIMHEGLTRVFTGAKVVVDHDLVGAAYSVYDGRPNITCIIGTGSNSCFFDGNEVYEEVPALAYILGDEASGSYFGKMLLSNYFYKRLPQELMERFESTYQLSKDDMIDAVYRKDNANVYLASFMKFYTQNGGHPLLKEWVKEGIRKFIDIHVKCFDGWRDLPVHFIGSVGYYFEDCLQMVCEQEGVILGNIIKKPIYTLAEYHTKYIFNQKQENA